MRILNVKVASAAAICCVLAAAPASAAAPIGAFTTAGAWKFVSAPNLHPPKLHTDIPTKSSRLAPGYFMIANFKNATSTGQQVGQGGPLILDSHLQPVWFFPVGGGLSVTNLRTQTYKGKPALSWWQGTITNTGATTTGEDVVVDHRYRIVARLSGVAGWILSPHEFLIAGGDAWVTAYKVVPMDLSPYGGSSQGFLLDSAVQEYNLKTGKLIFNWDIANHVALTTSETHPAPVAGIPWDAYHVNSIQLSGPGTFLVSMRSTWAAYLVNIATGKVAWTLGGKASTFTIPAAAAFGWQHDVELHPGNQVSMFDDACCAILGAGKFGPPLGPSRGLVLSLDTATHSVSFVRQYTHGASFETSFLGNTQLLPSGNVVVGWGSQPFISEFSQAGTLLFDAELPGADVSYRAVVSPWVATPLTLPGGAARTSGAKVTVYASWDGATAVSAWKVLAGRDARHLAAVALRSKTGFETAMRLNKTHKMFKIEALDAKGHVLGTSRAFHAVAGGGTIPKVCFYPPCTG